MLISNFQVLNRDLTALWWLPIGPLFIIVISCPLFVLLVFNISVFTVFHETWNYSWGIDTPQANYSLLVKNSKCAAKQLPTFLKCVLFLTPLGYASFFLFFALFLFSFLSVRVNWLNLRVCKHCHQAVVLSLNRYNAERKQGLLNTTISSFCLIQTNEQSSLLCLKQFLKLIYYSWVGKKI